jgi:YVTN family beta-propeller protein
MAERGGGRRPRQSGARWHDDIDADLLMTAYHLEAQLGTPRPRPEFVKELNMHLTMIAAQPQPRLFPARLRLAWLGWAAALALTLLVASLLLTLRPRPPQMPGVVALPLVRTVTVGLEPYASLTIDEQTSRAFVVNRVSDTVSVLDTRTGALLRTVPGNTNFGPLAVSARTGHVFLSSNDGTIHMLDARTGALLHTTADGDNYVIAADDRTNHVFVGHASGPTVAMLDARTGALLRNLNIPNCFGPFVVAVGERTGHLFARCNGGGLATLDARSGRLLHFDPTLAGAYGNLVVDEPANRVYSTSNDRFVHIFDAQSGKHLRALPNLVGTAPAVDERTGRVYVGYAPGNGNDATVTTSGVAILDGRTGTVLRQVPIAANPLAIAVDSQTGRVLVTSAGKVDGATSLPLGPGMLSVLDGATGRVLRTVPVGVDPSDVQIDARARRAVVVNSYSDIAQQGRQSQPGAKGTVMTFDLSHL